MRLNLVLFFVYSLLFTSGTATFVVGTLLLRKFPLPEIKLFFCFWIALSLAVFSNMVHFYLRGVAAFDVSIFRTLSVSGIALFCGLSFFFLYRMLLAFFQSGRRSARIFSWAILAMSLATAVVPFFRNRDQIAVYADFRLEWGAVPVLLFFLLGSIAIWMLRRRRELTDPLRARLFRPLLMMMVLFWAVMTLDTILGIARSILDGMPFFYLYYVSWNLLSLVFAFNYLLRRGTSRSLVTEPTEDFIKKCCLTDREVQVASLIANARSNKEIAFEIGISYDTVRSHVYNLFKKAGVGSRTELIRRLNHIDPS